MAYGERLGCASTYTATIHWQGGDQVFMYLDTVESISWSRTRRGVSEATVSLAKPRISPGCNDKLPHLWPWVHEVTIYRGTTAVWQGPLVRRTETRSTITLHAKDCGAWLERRILKQDRKLTNVDLSEVARAVVESALAVRDPGIVPRIVAEPSGRSGSRTIRAYSRMGMDELSEVAGMGVDWSFVGRTLHLSGPATEDTPAQGRLTSDDLLGEPELELDGDDYASLVYAAPQAQENVWNHLEAVGGASPYFGLVEHVAQTSLAWNLGDGGDFEPQGQDGLTEAQTVDALERAASTRFTQMSRPPIVVRVSQNAHLSPDSPIDLDRLVPGARIDLALEGDFTFPIRRAMRLTRVDVEFGTRGETIGVSLVQIGTGSDEEVEQP